MNAKPTIFNSRQPLRNREILLSPYSRRVTDRHFDGLQVQFGRAEDQFKIAQRVEVAEIGAPRAFASYSRRRSILVPHSVSV